MKRKLGQFFGDDCGATAIEYAFLAGLIFIVIVASVQKVGTRLSSLFESVSNY